MAYFRVSTSDGDLFVVRADDAASAAGVIEYMGDKPEGVERIIGRVPQAAAEHVLGPERLARRIRRSS
jgi:hypothetical protein